MELVDAEHRPLLVPEQRQLAGPLQSLGGEGDRLGAVEDRLDQVRSQEGELQRPRDVADMRARTTGDGAEACISQLPVSPRGAKVAADGSPESAGVSEPASECGAPSANSVQEPEQSLGPPLSEHVQGEPGSTSAGSGRQAGEGACSSASTFPRIDLLCTCDHPARAFAVPRDGAGVEQLSGRLAGLRCELIVLEATGGFEITVAAGLAAAGLPLAVVNPAQIRAFARAIGRLAKTDRLDAELIARFAEQVRPSPGRSPTRRPGCWPSSSRDDASWSR